MVERYEKYFFCLAVALVCLPLAIFEYAPSGDGPEHVLNAQMLSHLHEAPLLHFELNSGAAPTQFLKYIPSALTSGLGLPLTLRLLMIGLLVFLAFSVRFAALAQGEGAKFIILVPFVLADISFLKGFLNFYAGLSFVMLSYGSLIRFRSNSRLVAYALCAVGAIVCHPLAFAFLGIIVLVELLRVRDLRFVARTMVASIPSVLIAALILFSLMSNVQSGEIKLQHLFTTEVKITDFFKEAWFTASLWQKVAPMAVTSLMLVAAIQARPNLKRWPWISIVLFLTYLMTPEGMSGWSWISIRMPLLIILFLVVEVQGMPRAPDKLVNVWMGAALLLALMSTTQITRKFQELSEAINEFVSAGKYVKRETVLTPLMPISFPKASRVNVLTHASAYITATSYSPYPSMFARDDRVHSYLFKQTSKKKIYGSHAKLSWHQFVDPKQRISWFCEQSTGDAISFDLAKIHFEQLSRCADLVHKNKRAMVWRREKSK